MTEVPLCEFNIFKLYKIDSRIDTSTLTDDQWNALETTKTGEDGQYLIYQAKTPGFSPFVITTANIKSEIDNSQVNTPPSTEITPIEEMNNSTESGVNNPTGSEKKSLSGIPIVIIAVIGLIVVILTGLIVREKRKK